jgi:hypothetical protein
MVNHNHDIELINHHGSDKSHYQAISFIKEDDVIDINDKRMPFIRRAYESKEFDCFKNSLITFKLKTDMFCYFKIREGNYGNVITKGYMDSYSIPIDWSHIKSRKKIEGFGEAKEPWYNLLMRYSELGGELRNEIKKTPSYSYLSNRMDEVSNYFRPLNTHVEYLLSFSFYGFVNFFNDNTCNGSLAEMQELSYFMLDSIINMDEKPFQQSLKVFELTKK